MKRKMVEIANVGKVFALLTAFHIPLLLLLHILVVHMYDICTCMYVARVLVPLQVAQELIVKFHEMMCA